MSEFLDNRVDYIDQCRIFMRVVACASFTGAADQLSLPRSTVSEAVRQLEQRMDALLLHRTTRRVAPTRDGLLFHARCERMVAEVEATQQMFRQSPRTLSGQLKVDLPARIGRLIVAPALPDFLHRHPGLDVTLGMTDRAVDLVAHGVDCVLRVGPLPDSSLVARGLGQLPLINVASADYLRRHGTPEHPCDLDEHLAVLYASPTSGRVEPWEWEDRGGVHTRRVAGRVTVDSAEAYIACCLAGLGLIQVPAYDVQDEIARGQLVEVMPAFRAEPMPITLLYPDRRQVSARLRIFGDWLMALIARETRRHPIGAFDAGGRSSG